MKRGINIHTSSGYALLFAVLVSSILLSAGLGIANIIYKELLLSSIGRESTRAFYVADSGAECALYWDSKPLPPHLSYFPTYDEYLDASLRTPSTVAAQTARCAETDNIFYGVDTSLKRDELIEPVVERAFTIFKVSVGGGCALVTVKKDATGTTFIESRGFNVNCNNTSNPRRVERAVRYRIN